jgi:hypothetical protein
METSESYRTSVLPDLSGRGAAAAKTLLVAGPVALLGAQLAAHLQSASGLETVLDRVAAPLMLAWAAVLFLLARRAAPVAAWTGLVAVTLQVSLVQQVTDGWVLLTVETVGFVAFAVALWRLAWVPRLVPVLLVAFPVVDAFTPGHGNLLATLGFAAFVAAALVLAARMGPRQEREPLLEAPQPQPRLESAFSQRWHPPRV